ncbi:hypothetical protein Rsub_11534 [Raphidocelis subcapitata]|uniref:Uncharacterized protein n=1 Tax=Raphidocelis subcapitata TaxID=307507 RepID=A0A2V0PGK8_9CHLO|nr:hypothetical protein Rsub_11534 [Raphidocelis subcapitata]|eukprot:GBF98896.1 hypothetical protein Rsub_11534 [Raphidocelis subcapitata]
MGCELEFGPRPSEVHVVRLVSLWQLPEPEPPLTGWAKFKANLKSKLCFGPPMTREDQFVLEACSPKPGERQVSMFRHAVADIREHAQELLIRERSLGRRERSLERREAELQAAREATVAESVLVAEAVAPLNGRVRALEDELFSAKVTTRYARRHILEGRYFQQRARYLEWREEHLGKVAEAARVEAGWACAQTKVACAVAEAMRAETEGAHAYIELQRQHGKELARAMVSSHRTGVRKLRADITALAARLRHVRAKASKAAKAARAHAAAGRQAATAAESSSGCETPATPKAACEPAAPRLEVS